jgi:sodium transport system ATP-binding protein
MIAGLLTPDQGQVLVAGKSPQIDPLYIKRTLGFLTGNTKLYQRLTPLELLHFFGTLQEMCKADINRRIEQIVAELDIGEFLKQPCGSLSTGQTQRVNIARALLHDPPILILDEPTAGLDLISADFILKVIRRCRQQHKAVIFSTHILAETELLCDRIGVLYRGKLAAEGTLEQLLAQTNTPNMANAFLQIVATSDALHANNNRDSTSENE